MRVFVAGFQHETNTFAPSKADWAAFEAGSGYPPAARGPAMLEQMQGGSLPMGGFIRSARARGWTLAPSLWAGAVPSAHVTREAFEHIAGCLAQDLRAALAAGRLDAIYLDLHGAAVAEHVDDAEGEILARLRAVAGPSVPVVASLDLHANVSDRMLGLADAMTAFRTYPHVDMAETGERAAALLARLAAARAPWHTERVRLPFLLPLNSQCTALEPAARLMRRLSELEAETGAALSFAMGFPAADIPDCGATVFGHGRDPEAARRAVRTLADEAVAARAEWALELLEPDAAVTDALALAAGGEGRGPVVIADTQDNPGAGGDACTTGLLHALLRAGAGRRFPGRVALGLLCDPEAARAAHAAGLGATFDGTLGRSVTCFDGRSSAPPVQARLRVVAVDEGRVALHGPMTAGATAQLGPSAALEVDGIRVLVTSRKSQLLDLDLCRFLGVEPAETKLLVVKSSVHFRAAFAPLAQRILVARSPGPMAADPGDLPWRRLREGVAARP